jgi:hypothetical protein
MQFTDVLVHLDVHNMVISEINHVSSMTVTLTFPKLALGIDDEVSPVAQST